jgi:hypothetical protein
LLTPPNTGRSIKEQRLKRSLSEDALRTKITDFNYDVSKFETYVTDLQLEIASWNSQASYPDLEHHVLQALATVKSSLFQFDVRVIQKDHTKRLRQFAVDGIESAEMTTSEILQLARDEYLDHIAHRTWKLDILESEETRLTFINATKNFTESQEWKSTTKTDRKSTKPATTSISSDDGKPPHWRNEPPKPGEPHTRDHKNGRTGETAPIKWCKNCGGAGNPGRWNSTHLTKDHNSDFYKDKGSNSTTHAKPTQYPSTGDLRMSTSLIAKLANQGCRNDEEEADLAHQE